MKTKIQNNKIPKHIAIIMDGNGRWAKKHGKERFFGHQEGVETLKKIAAIASNLKIKYLTLFTFSTENWNRPQSEVNALMELMVVALQEEIETLNKNNISLRVVGDINKLNPKTYEQLNKTLKTTQNNTGMKLVLAISYSAKWDILNATKKIAKLVKNGKINESEINENIFKNNLSTKQYPYPELLIRTSGEHRISNFLLWELAYSELYFSKKFWPEFSENDFIEAILDFQKRERRFGKTTEQLKKIKS